MKTLYPHQEKAVQSIFDYFKDKNGNPLIVAPVGSGKSVMIAEFIKRAQAMHPDTNIMVVTHVRELLVQNAQELLGQYPDACISFYCAGLGEKSFDGTVIMASVQSVHRHVFKLDKQIDLLLIDEAHLTPHNEDTTYQSLIKNLKVLNPHLKVIGFTGTPFRPNGRSLLDGENAIFTDIAYQIPMLYLIDKGFLCPLVTPEIRTRMSVDGVGMRNGDYIESQLQKAVDHDNITKACVDEIIEHGANRHKWLVFTAGVEHCEHVMNEIRSRGISCEMVTGETPKGERDSIVERYKNGDLRCLVNVACFTTGFNNPAIDLMALMRPMRSPVLYVQCSGRGMRTSSKTGKVDCTVLDFGGVITALGPVDTIDAREYNARVGAREGDAPIKVCPNCHTVCFAGVRECHECAYVWPREINIVGAAAKNAAILSNQNSIQRYAVVDMKCYRHQKEGKPTSMRVSYLTEGGKSFNEWICFEHSGYAREKASKWHHARSNLRVPNTVDEALAIRYPIPVSIAVKPNGKFFEIVAHDMRGDWQEQKLEQVQEQNQMMEEIIF